MPKIKDLGIKVIPETMQPPEVGGGGARACNFSTFGCTDCTNQPYSICGTTPCGPITNAAAARACLPTAGCTDCTVQQFSICGTTPGGGCGFTCSDCTVQAFSICGTTPGHCGFTCTDCTVQPFSICGTTPHGCLHTFQCRPTFCGITVGCTAPFSLCGPISPRCGVSIDPTIAQQPPEEITRDQIAKAKDALRQQIAALEEQEKNLGPRTAEEIDAREKQLNAELDRLKARRKELK